MVGDLFGKIADCDTDVALLPSQLSSYDQNLSSFALSYVKSRYQISGWSWVDNIDMRFWEKDQVMKFLYSLPFCHETWTRMENLLGDMQSEYWKGSYPNYRQAQGYLSLAVENLIQHGRPFAALHFLFQMYKNGETIDSETCLRALRNAAKSDEPTNSMSQFYAIELIRALQEKKIAEAKDDDIAQIEWVYLQWLDFNDNSHPKCLEKKLADDPDFFCVIIQTLFRSDKDDSTPKESNRVIEAFAKNAWRLICNWRTIPGLREDRSIDEAQINLWIEKVKENCIESGHLEIALSEIGKILARSPSDADGFWPHHSVAKILNTPDAEIMRNGFKISLLNSRGVHAIDPTGRPELELAGEYREKADAIESAGYFRLAIAMRDIAITYENDAERIIAKYPHGEV